MTVLETEKRGRNLRTVEIVQHVGAALQHIYHMTQRHAQRMLIDVFTPDCAIVDHGPTTLKKSRLIPSGRIHSFVFVSLHMMLIRYVFVRIVNVCLCDSKFYLLTHSG